MIAKDPFSNCLNSAFSLSVDSVIPSDTDKDLHLLTLLSYVCICICVCTCICICQGTLIYPLHTVPQHLDSHNYNIYSIIGLSFPIETHYFVEVVAFEATLLQLLFSVSR